MDAWKQFLMPVFNKVGLAIIEQHTDMLKDVIIIYIEYLQLGLKAGIGLTEEHCSPWLLLIKL
jgi:hypothetical protein